MSGLRKELDNLTSLEDALMSILPQIEPIDESESLKVEKAHGRVIAEDIFSPLDIPSVPSASMDGYAIRAEDTIDATPKAHISKNNK